MANSPLGEIEDLTLCSYCKQAFNDTDQTPKLLACKHHFCLKCVNTVLLNGRELYCIHCWKCTELPEMRAESLPTHQAILALAQRLSSGVGLLLPPKQPDKNKLKAESCHTHAMPYTLWCLTCSTQICRACAGGPDHALHVVKPHIEARQILQTDIHNELTHIQKLITDMNQLVYKQRDFMVKILEACITLKTQVETELVNNTPNFELSDANEHLNRARQNLLHVDSQTPAEIHSFLINLNLEKEKLQLKHQELFMQCKIDDLISNAGILIDFDHLKQALTNGDFNLQTNSGCSNPVLFLANYCTSQVYSRHMLLNPKQNNNHYPSIQNGHSRDYQVLTQALIPTPNYAPLVLQNNLKMNQNYDQMLKSHFPSEHNLLPSMNMAKSNTSNFVDSALQSPNLKKNIMPFQTEALSMALPPILPNTVPQIVQNNVASPPNQLQVQSNLFPTSLIQHSPQPMLRNPSSHMYPLFYFNIEMNSQPYGRILIEVRNDVAPKMSKNFGVLATGELGIGYKGCNIFQCWENESIITGDFEMNNGRGGRSIFEETFFMPDDTKILAVRGSVGMRRSQKKHDNSGLVGSQFRIILREMRGFTGIFAFVVEGLELIDRISQNGDSAGKPQNNIVIASCGKFNLS